MTKPISFKPSTFDQSLIDTLIATDKYKTTADLLRNAIMQLALVSLDEESYHKAIAKAYERDVKNEF